jgi:hypothetical protein
VSVWLERLTSLVPSIREDVEGLYTDPQLDESTAFTNALVTMWIAFCDAYEKPVADSTHVIDGIWAFARWALHESGDIELENKILVGFWEDLPSEPRIRADLPNRMTSSELDDLKEIFCNPHSIGPAGFAELRQEFESRRDRTT